MISAVAAVALLAGASLAFAVGLTGTSGQRTYSPNEQLTAWTTQQATTSSTTFIQLPGFGPLPVASRGRVVVTFSANFSGAAVAIRAVKAGERVLIPGPATFQPTAESASFSFTFMARHGVRDCTLYALEWRSPSGQRVHLKAADVTITYRRAPNNKVICEYP